MLYAHNLASIFNQDRMDAVHKARYVGKKDALSALNLDAFALEQLEI